MLTDVHLTLKTRVDVIRPGTGRNILVSYFKKKKAVFVGGACVL